MRRLLPFFAVLALVGIVASIACFVTLQVTQKHSTGNHADEHHWIHTQLGLSKQQEEQLTPIEQRYDEQKRHYGEVIRLANMELAQAILADKSNSPRVKAAIGKIHDAQGQLQNATLQHVFEMEPVLTPEQYEKLLNLTANALYEVTRGH